MSRPAPDPPFSPPAGAESTVEVRRYGAGESGRDRVAVEEPLEIRVVAEIGSRRVRHPLAVTMRTPGHDSELVAGFLLTEGVIRERADIARLAICAEDPGGNVVEAWLAPGVAFDPERHRRDLYAASSCGVCGKASIELIRTALPAPIASGPRLTERFVAALAGRLGEAQPVFGATGGLHAAALFDAEGRRLVAREDVGRHNALDKLVGERLLAGALPAVGTVVLLSGRAGFELVQKAAMAGIPVVAAIGAPSSLAIETARETGQTLIGFLRRDRFNLYAGQERVRAATR